MVFKHRLFLSFFALAVGTVVVSSPACAVDVTSGSVALGSADSTQQGRLVRNGVPQDFAGDEQFPGENNLSTTFAYTTKDVAFAANAIQDVYYDITFDDVATDLFASAYLNSYDPSKKASNWLGDAGTSGNDFGVDALYFDVMVPKGEKLLLVFNSAVPGLPTTSIGNYFVSAYSDAEYDENFSSAVPEASTWLMMILGFGAVGGVMRSAHRKSEAKITRRVRSIATA